MGSVSVKLGILVGIWWALAPVALSADVNVGYSEDGSAIEGRIDGMLAFRYNLETVPPPHGKPPYYARSGFIHPLCSPSGTVVTDDFPVGHTHQHGLFSAWTKATFRHLSVDFWNQQDETGTVEHVELESIEEDGFAVRLQQVARGRGPAIDERWEVRLRALEGMFVLDVLIQQRPATNHEIYFHPFHYGGFAVRGSAYWNNEGDERFEGAMRILTDSGEMDREAANHTRPRWIAAYGPVKGTTAGFAMMDHPGNFRHPQPVRSHPEIPYLVYTPVALGSFVLQPGFVYEARYRVVTYDGEPKAEKLESIYGEFVE